MWRKDVATSISDKKRSIDKRYGIKKEKNLIKRGAKKRAKRNEEDHIKNNLQSNVWIIRTEYGELREEKGSKVEEFREMKVWEHVQALDEESSAYSADERGLLFYAPDCTRVMS
jgi:hypothetical protein